MINEVVDDNSVLISKLTQGTIEDLKKDRSALDSELSSIINSNKNAVNTTKTSNTRTTRNQTLNSNRSHTDSFLISFAKMFNGKGGANRVKNKVASNTTATEAAATKEVVEKADKQGFPDGGGYFKATNRQRDGWNNGQWTNKETGDMEKVGKFGVAIDYMVGGTAGQIGARVGAAGATVYGASQLFGSSNR